DGGPRRLPQRQPRGRPPGCRGGARLGAGARGRPAGGSRLALREGVAVRVAAAGGRLRHLRRPAVLVRESVRAPRGPGGAALVGDVRGAEVARDLRRAGAQASERRGAVGGAGGERVAGVRARVGPSGHAGGNPVALTHRPAAGWPLQTVAWFTSASHVFEGMRTVLAGGAVPWERMAWAAALDVVYVGATLAVFGWALRYARRHGKLSRFGD